MALDGHLIENVKPKDGPFKQADGGGMYLLVQPNGAKYWRLDYRFAGKQKTLALGVYPAVSLVDARALRLDALELLVASIDPSEERKKERARFQEENTRRKADLIKNLQSMRLVSFPDGMREIWHGRKLIATLRTHKTIK
ncbi:MAG: Arm DNA-binding domain-containing protein [Sulfuricellaceae bacterium]|nr:Arm DNA-binding domain-containing protein [Sulfuricellaceae bacterium]